MVAKPCGYVKNHLPAHFEMVTSMAYELGQ